jgi:hypothetical protein
MANAWLIPIFLAFVITAGLWKAFTKTGLVRRLHPLWVFALLASFIVSRLGWGFVITHMNTVEKQSTQPRITRSQDIPDYGRVSGMGTSLVDVELEPGSHIFASQHRGSEWDAFHVKLLDQSNSPIATISECSGSCESTVTVEISARGNYSLDIASADTAPWSISWQIK